MRTALIVVALALTIAILAVMLAPRAAYAGACQTVVASWYGIETCNGRKPGTGRHDCKTADGTPFDGTQFLVAHKTLPLGTKVRITYKGKSVVVRVRDRGPYIKGRSLDLSRAAAERIGLIQAGVGKVCMERL